MDNIKPNEFTFCGRCGVVCRLGGTEFTCCRCKGDLFGMSDEDRLFMPYELRMSDILKEYRTKLNDLRGVNNEQA